MKGEILKKLREACSQYVSGEQLSDMLGVTRTSIWKYIKELKSEGYIIDSSSKKGYALVSIPDVVSPWEIKYGLNTEMIGKDIRYFAQIDSTNNYAKKIAQEGCSNGTVVTADCQTIGRGRLGRAWDSSDKKGVWMSVVLRPEISIEEVQTITLAASVAVVDAIKETIGVQAGIKWPNDIILDGKKVCGILTEMNLEMERVNYLVLGIGLNVNQDKLDFPEDLREKAVSLKGYLIDNSLNNFELRRSQLIKSILSNLEKIYYKIEKAAVDEIIQDWKKYSVTLGKEVSISFRDGQYIGTACDITKDGKLVVECQDGITREVLSGEVSVRGFLGYV